MKNLKIGENDMDMEFLTVEDVQKILKIGKNQAYDLFKSADFPSFKVGKQHRIPKDEFKKWCEKKSYNSVRRKLWTEKVARITKAESSENGKPETQNVTPIQ